jgi:uncharacterized protein YodC (DUF2158 family)
MGWPHDFGLSVPVPRRTRTSIPRILPLSKPRTGSEPVASPISPRARYLIASFVAVATLGIVLVAVGRPAYGRSPILEAPGDAVAGSLISVAGTGFSPDEEIQLTWDGVGAGMPHAQADARGRFYAMIVIPADATPGDHALAAVRHGIDSGSSQEAATASTTVSVRSAAAPLAVPAPPSPRPLQGPSVATAPEPVLPPPRPSITPDPSEAAQPTTAHAGHPAPSPGDGGGSAGQDAPSPQPSKQPQPSKPPPSPDPHDPPVPIAAVDCNHYAEPRTFLEIHTWWEGEPLERGRVAHLHVGACVPLGQVASGVVPFDVRIVLHDNPGHLYRYETGLFTDGAGEGGPTVVPLDHRCRGTCEYWVRTLVDTRQAHDGWHELRFKARVEFSNGDVQLTSSGWPILTSNGNRDGGGRESGGIVGRGWYDGRGYQNAALRSEDDVVPGRVIRGVWRPAVRLDAGADGEPTTFSAAYIGPDFHGNDEDSSGGGVVLGEWSGPFDGQLRIDTTRLPNGRHTLVLRTEARHDGHRLTGLQYVDFVVGN